MVNQQDISREGIEGEEVTSLSAHPHSTGTSNNVGYCGNALISSNFGLAQNGTEKE